MKMPNGFKKKKKWTSPLNFTYSKFQVKLTILIFWTKLTEKGYFHNKKEENENHLWVLYIWITLGSKFWFQQIFLNRFPQKMILPVKNRKKMNVTIEFFIFDLVSVPNFRLNWKFWFFELPLPEKDILNLTQIKWTPPLKSAESN